MKKVDCKRCLETTGDKHNCGGRFEIVYDTWDDGSKYYYLKCSKCGEEFDD